MSIAILTVMNDRQENKLGMYRATGEVLASNASIYAGVPAMVTNQQNFLDSISLIDSLAQAQSAVTTGVTIDKTNFGKQMVAYTMRVAGQLKAYGSQNNNATLFAKADAINDTKFVRARDDDRDDIAQDIHDEANKIIAGLANYGTTAATLSALQTRIDAYRLALPSTTAVRKTRKTNTELIKQEFARAEMLLNDRLDGLILQFEEANPQFVLAYNHARETTNTGSRGKDEDDDKESGTTPPAPK